MRIALGAFPPFLMAGTRFVLAGAILYAFLRMRGGTNPRPVEWRASAAVGLLMVGSNVLVIYAQQWVGSGLASLVVAAVPLWAAIYGGIWRRWPTRPEMIGILVGFSGIVLLNLGSDLGANPLAAVALLVSTLTWAFGSIWGRTLSLPPGLMASAAQMLAGGTIVLVAGIAMGERMSRIPSGAPLFAFLFLVFGGSLAAFTAYTYLLAHVRASLATSYAYVNPVVAVVLGAFLAGEAVTAWTLCAMAVILAGVATVVLAQPAKSTK
jgi:drug/metabolite transporter (DMT)-like permease